MIAWVARYAMFALAAHTGMLGLIVAGILLHGICYDFFFVTGFIYVDKKATAQIRAQAQGFLVLVTQGVGMLIGAQVSGILFKKIVTGEGQTLLQNWHNFWLIPCGMALVVTILFFLLFRDEGKSAA